MNMKEEKKYKVNAKVLRWLRVDSYCTKYTVAEVLGVSVRQVRDWESDLSKDIEFTYEELEKLAKLFDCPITNFFLSQEAIKGYRPLPLYRAGVLIAPEYEDLEGWD